MADCPCTILPTTTSIAVTTGNVTYDGGATCTGFNAGDVNDFISHIATLVCDLQDAIVALTIDPADISVTGLTVLPCINPALYADFNEYIDELAHIVCEVQTDLSTLVIADIGGTFDLSCINVGYGASTLQQAIDRLTVAICAIKSSQYTLDLLRAGGSLELPLMPFAKDTLTITDISALGVAKVNIDATDYWINATALSMIGTNITPLVDSQDNYIFIDADTAAYDWTAVAIGAAAPVTNGDKVAMVRTGVGTVTSINRLIGYSPIDSDILEDDSIDATKLTTTICTTPLENDGTNIILNYDNDDFTLSAGNLALKTACIDNTGYIDMAGVCEPSIKLSGGNKLEAGVGKSIELDAVTGLIQLVGDFNVVPEWGYYGTDDVSDNRGYHSILHKHKGFSIPSMDVLLLKSVPYEILASSGANYYISVDKIVLSIPDAGTDYVSANALEARYTDGSGVKVTADIPNTFLESSSRQTYVAHGTNCVVTDSAPIVLCVPVGDPTTGTKAISGIIFYSEHIYVG